jgi:hypothetical protein
MFWVKSEAINQQENRLLGLYDHPWTCTVPLIAMHPASVGGQALLYDQPLFSNPSCQIKLHPSLV